MTAYGPVETLARLTANIITIQDRTSEKLNRAVLNSDVNLIRDYYRAGSESLQDTLEAILRTDNVQLLNDFVRSTKQVTDGAIRENGNLINTPVLKYGLWRNAFKCVLFLKGLGVNLDCVRLTSYWMPWRKTSWTLSGLFWRKPQLRRTTPVPGRPPRKETLRPWTWSCSASLSPAMPWRKAQGADSFTSVPGRREKVHLTGFEYPATLNIIIVLRCPLW